jgi:16S rRNA G966 N2-methylase RsmD
MRPEQFTKEQKEDVARQIKPIPWQTVEKEMQALQTLDVTQLSPRCRLGNNIVDYFTFVQRLETRGKYNVTFFEFIENLDEFRTKKFIQTMFAFYENVSKKEKNKYVLYKSVYNICISAINIMKPVNCMEIYKKYGAKRVLNFCAGWGGSAVAAAALHLDSYYGIEINRDLETPYQEMVTYLKTVSPTTEWDIRILNALEVNYEDMQYDTVFTSPPYYFIEKYAHNATYETKSEMNQVFYRPLFEKTYRGLSKGGYYIINVCKEVYEEVLVKLLGNAQEIFPLKKSKRQNEYQERVYVWRK